MLYIIATLKLLAIIIFFPILGNFIVVNLFNIHSNWIENVFGILACLLTIDVVYDTITKDYFWKRIQTIRSKIEIALNLIISLVIVFLPKALGLDNLGYQILFILLAIFMTFPLWWLAITRINAQIERNT